MRVMANMKVIVPCDSIEARKATVSAAKIWGPVYLRLTREKTPIITTENTPFIPGKIEIFWESKKPEVLIVGAGPILHNALLAAKILEKEKIGTVVVNCHTIKPLDKKIAQLAAKVGAVVTVEEHQVLGGLGGAIAELLAKTNPVPMEFIGMQDTFGESGEPKELLKKYKMSPEDIVSAVKRALKRK